MHWEIIYFRWIPLGFKGVLQICFARGLIMGSLLGSDCLTFEGRWEDKIESNLIWMLYLF